MGILSQCGSWFHISHMFPLGKKRVCYPYFLSRLLYVYLSQLGEVSSWQYDALLYVSAHERSPWLPLLHPLFLGLQQQLNKSKNAACKIFIL